VDTVQHKIMASGINSFSRWTAADGSRPLGGSGTDYVFNANWNMISVPLTLVEYRKSVLFPDATSNAFAYEGSYVVRDTLSNKIGYWLKFPAAEVVTLDGAERTKDTIDVVDGWNMIGSISNPVPVNTIA